MTPEELAAKELADKQAADLVAQEAAAAEEAKKKAEEEDLSKLTLEETKSRLEKEIKDRKEANKEAQQLRKRANDLEEADKKRKESEMTDLQKAQAESADLKMKNAQIALEAQNTRIMLTASNLGFNDPKDAVALLNKTDLKDDESNLENLLKDVLKTKPYLKKADGSPLPRTPGHNPGDGSGGTGDKEKKKQLTSIFPTLGRVRQN